MNRFPNETDIMIPFIHRKQTNAHYNSMDKNYLQKIMNEKEISYGMLAKTSGISKGTLHKIANFYQSPTQDTMIAIARGLNMNVDEVFNLNWRK